MLVMFLFEYDVFNWLQRAQNPTDNQITLSTELNIFKELKSALVLFAVNAEGIVEAQ